MSQPEAFAARLRRTMERTGMNSPEFGPLFFVTDAQVRQYLGGRHMPLEHLEALLRAEEIPVEDRVALRNLYQREGGGARTKLSVKIDLPEPWAISELRRVETPSVELVAQATGAVDLVANAGDVEEALRLAWNVHGPVLASDALPIAKSDACCCLAQVLMASNRFDLAARFAKDAAVWAGTEAPRSMVRALLALSTCARHGAAPNVGASIDRLGEGARIALGRSKDPDEDPRWAPFWRSISRDVVLARTSARFDLGMPVEIDRRDFAHLLRQYRDFSGSGEDVVELAAEVLARTAAVYGCLHMAADAVARMFDPTTEEGMVGAPLVKRRLTQALVLNREGQFVKSAEKALEGVQAAGQSGQVHYVASLKRVLARSSRKRAI